MQDRYAGDIGDYAKYALLRAVFEGCELGVAWYLHPDESKSADGRYTDYLNQPAKWRHLDEDLFDRLEKIVASSRSVAAIQASSILPQAVFADARLNITDIPVRRRESWRRTWFDGVRQRLEKCDVVFADPDNGLVRDDNFRPTRKGSVKGIPEEEVGSLSAGRPMVVYHHNTRRKGGHKKEIAYWQNRLPGQVHAYYWRRWSNRTFFFVNSYREIVDRLEAFAERWNADCRKPRGELIPPR